MASATEITTWYCQYCGEPILEGERRSHHETYCHARPRPLRNQHLTSNRRGNVYDVPFKGKRVKCHFCDNVFNYDYLARHEHICKSNPRPGTSYNQQHLKATMLINILEQEHQEHVWHESRACIVMERAIEHEWWGEPGHFGPGDVFHDILVAGMTPDEHEAALFDYMMKRMNE